MCLRLRVRLCDKSNSLLRLVGGVSQTHTTHATVLGGCPLFELLLIILRSQWHDWPVLGHRLSHTWNCHLVLGGVIAELLRDAWNEVVVRLIEELLLNLSRLLLLRNYGIIRRRVLWVCVRKRLNLSSATCYSLILLNLQDATGVDRLDVTSLSITVLLVLFVNVKEELLDLVACSHVLRIESRTDTEMKWFFRLFLLRTFLESWSLSSKSQFNDFLRLRHVLAALLDYPLHIATFRSNQTPSNLELLVVWDLDIISTRILGLTITI